MTPVEERLRDLRSVTRSEVKPSPQLLGRIRYATGRRRRWTQFAKPSRMAVLAVALAAVIFSMAVGGRYLARPQAGRPVATAPPKQVIPSSFVYQYAGANPGARRLTLISADGKTKIPVVVLPDGASVLGRGDLPVLSRFETYQLWGIVGGQEISLAVVGANPDFVSFTAPSNVTMLFITVEAEGGVVNSAKLPLVSGLLNNVGFDGGAVRGHVV